MDAFEKKIFNIDNVVPTCLISYSFIEGIGRRSFLKNALIRNRIVDKLYDPPYIPFSSKESIEDFIYKLNFIKKDNAIFQADLAAMDLIEKIELAKKLVRKYVQNNELIFLIR